MQLDLLKNAMDTNDSDSLRHYAKIRELLSSAVKSNFASDQQSSSTQDSSRNIKVAKTYDISYVAEDFLNDVEEDRVAEFYYDPVHAVKIGNIYFRLFLSGKYDMHFVGVHRRNSPFVAKGHQDQIKHTYMRLSLWESSECMGELEKIMQQIACVKGLKRVVIKHLKNDTHSPKTRDNESFYDPAFTVISPSKSFMTRPYLSAHGYAFRFRANQHRQIGGKLWLGSQIGLFYVS